MDSSRRVFLKLVAAAPLSGVILACGSNSSEPAQFGDISAGNVSGIPVGTLRLIGGEPAVIARDSGGLYAMTVTCTHQGCEVEPSGSGNSVVLNCPCHGSRFDRNGAVVRGPAGAPLVHFAVDVDSAGNVTVHGGTQVDASTRTVVPA